MTVREVFPRGWRKQLPSIQDDFWAYVDQSAGPDACWPWTRGITSSGYGRVSVNGKPTPAHRHALELKHGPLRDGLLALHSCDNRACCNPAHLYAGTHGENMRDRSERDRVFRPHGERNAKAKLTRAEADEIRRRCASGATQASVAETFGVSQSTVCSIVHRKSWAAA